jgi:hypothetical protein
LAAQWVWQTWCPLRDVSIGHPHRGAASAAGTVTRYGAVQVGGVVVQHAGHAHPSQPVMPVVLHRRCCLLPYGAFHIAVQNSKFWLSIAEHLICDPLVCTCAQPPALPLFLVNPLPPSPACIPPPFPGLVLLVSAYPPHRSSRVITVYCMPCRCTQCAGLATFLLYPGTQHGFAVRLSPPPLGFHVHSPNPSYL